MEWEILLVVISESCLWLLDMCWEGLKLKKLFTDRQVHVFMALFPGGRKVVGVEKDLWLLELQCTFIWEILVGRFTCRKRNDNRKKNFFASNSL